MGRTRSDTLTPREAQIMEVLWQEGPVTAEQVREALPIALHDSTIRTMLRVLESKGYVRHRVRKRAFVFRAAVPRVQAERTALRSMLKRFFGGSAEALVVRLLEDEHLTPEQIEQLKQAHAPRAEGRKPGGKP